MKIYSVLQGIPENTSSLLTLSRNVLPSGMLGGDLPGNISNQGTAYPQKNTNIAASDGSPNKNENGIRPIREHKSSKKGPSFGSSFKSKDDVSPHDATAKLIRKNQMIARLDIVCLILFPIVFLLYVVIYLMTTIMI